MTFDGRFTGYGCQVRLLDMVSQAISDTSLILEVQMAIFCMSRMSAQTQNRKHVVLPNHLNPNCIANLIITMNQIYHQYKSQARALCKAAL